MKILDRYILGQFLRTFGIIIIAFSALFIIVDVFDRMSIVTRSTSDVSLIARYFLYRIPYLFVLTSPVTILLAGLFLMDLLSKYNESIAVRASGVSIIRLVTPLFIFAFLYSLLIMWFGDFVLPQIEDAREHIFRVKIRGQEREDVRMRSNIQYRGEDNTLYSIGFFDGFRNILRVIDVTSFNEDTNYVERKLLAQSADWDGEQWVFNDCYIRYFEDGSMVTTEYHDNVSLDDIYATPLDFIKSARSPMSMNYFELREYIERLRRVGDNYTIEMVDLYTKISFPFANFIIILFCVPLISVSARSKYRGMIFLVGITICFIYLTVIRICQSLGYNEIIEPATAAWLPHLIFLAVGLFFVVRAEV